MTDDPDETRHEAEAEERDAAAENREAAAGRRADAAKAERRKAIREWSILALAVAVGVVVLLQQFHSSTVTACQARYNNAFATNLTQRAALTDRDHQATTTLIESVAAPPRGMSKAEQRLFYAGLFSSYRRTEAQISAARRAHPFPQLPSKACR